jgi:hypothetical protein
MKTAQAIELAGGRKALADLLGVTLSAISQWDDDVPQSRVWQLRVLKPEWFDNRKPCCQKREKAH